MLSNFDSSDDSLVILKKSLQQTMIKVEKAISLIDENNNQPSLGNLIRLEKSLARNSDILLTYLQDNDRVNDDNNQFNTKNDRRLSRPSKYSQINQIDSVTPNSSRNSFSSSQQKSIPKINLIVVAVLVISLSVNIYTFFNNNQLVLATNKNIGQKEKIRTDIDNQPDLSSQKNESNDQDLVRQIPDKKDNNQVIENRNKMAKNKSLPIEDDASLQDNKNQVEKKETDSSLLELEEDITSSLPLTDLPLEEETEVEKSSLLITIENQLNKISDRYQENIIRKIKVNYNNNSLVIFIDRNWQMLEEKEQDKLSEELYQKAKSLDFYRFELKTIDNKLLARNAVVKDRLIILTHWSKIDN